MEATTSMHKSQIQGILIPDDTFEVSGDGKKYKSHQLSQILQNYSQNSTHLILHSDILIH